ncbi:MAG: T9SS type A sorting domain-containing protein [Sphingobacteriales bacterium]|nr:T9SS type A sorting domain-containing protein [Sphingobacteriales bacterium]
MKNPIVAVFLLVLTLSAAAQTTYTWKLAGGGNWATAANWIPSRSAPAASDILLVNNGGAKTISNVLTQTIGRLIISGNTTVTLTPTGGARTLTLSNAGLALDVQAGSGLRLIGENGGGSRSLTLRFAGAGNTVSIAGSLSLDIVSNDRGIINLNNSVTTVSGTIVNKGGTVGAAAGNLLLNSTANYIHATNGGTIPPAGWDAASTCSITGFTTSVPAGLNQSFGNLTWDCPGQSASANLNGQLNTVTGNLVVNNTNLYGLYLTTANNSSCTLSVGGNLDIRENAWFAISGGDNVTGTVNVGADFVMTGTSATSSYFDFHMKTGSSATLNKIILNVTGNFLQSGGLFDMAYGDSDVPNFTELRINGNMELTGTGTIQTGASDNSVSNGLIIFTKSGTQTIYATTPANSAWVNYQVNNGSTLQLLADINLSSHATAGWAGQFTVNSGATLEAGTARLVSSTGSTAGINNAFILNSGAVLVTANAGGVQQDAITGTVSTSIATRSYSSNADYEFRGDVTGIFTTAPAVNTVRNLVVNNAGGAVVMSQPFAVTGSLQLSNGNLVSSLASLLTINDNATAAGGSYSPVRYVEGPVRKIGDDPFTFPVGKSAIYAPVSISAAGSTTAEYRAEYFRMAPPNRANITAPGLKQISFCEYWDLEETGPGGPVVDVSLSWSGLSPCNSAAYVTNIADLTVAHFDGTNWNSHGNGGGSAGTASQGNVTRNAVTAFSIFTLGSTSTATNPLAVKFTEVKAYTEGSGNRVAWSNRTETNVRSYAVEKSTDALTFNPMAELPARSNTGTKEAYSVMDTHPDATQFYRIRATEFSGVISFSPVVKVVHNDAGAALFSVYPNPVLHGQFTVQLSAPAGEQIRLALYNTSGAEVFSTRISHPGGYAAQTVELPSGLSRGIYYLQLRGETVQKNSRLVLQ